EERGTDLELLEHRSDRFALIKSRAAGATTLGVRRERLLQLRCKPEVIDHESPRLVAEYAVHARDRLHQTVAAHRLVHVHRVQARRVEAREPHVAHKDDAQRVTGIAEAVGQSLAARLAAD